MRKPIYANPVGDVENVRLITQSNFAYKCETIRVQVGYKFWIFDCLQEVICPVRCFIDLPMRGSEKYEVNV